MPIFWGLLKRMAKPNVGAVQTRGTGGIGAAPVGSWPNRTKILTLSRLGDLLIDGGTDR